MNSIYGKDLGAGDGKNPDGNIHPGRGFAGTIQGQGGEVVFPAQVRQKKVFCSMLGKSGDGRRRIGIGKMTVIGTGVGDQHGIDVVPAVAVCVQRSGKSLADAGIEKRHVMRYNR